MAKIRVTKEFIFEAAHALWNYNGNCRHIHGHSYRLQVTVIGDPLDNSARSGAGMVIDFSELKKIVKDSIIDKFDHALILSRMAKIHYDTAAKQMFDKLILTDYQPTCENLVADFATVIRALLPAEVKLFSMRLYETANSWADWFADDNL
ncbi:MAG: 6-carboxytetrahydropterin synthase [Bacteroidota bacterium]